MISIVIPMFNESAGVKLLYDRLIASASSWAEDCEFIMVNDGSWDNTLDLCLEIAEMDGRFKVLSLSRNFGHQAAVTAGLCYTAGDIIAVMDADLQDPPEELIKFIAKCREGYDVVYAVRTKRKEGLLKRLSYRLYYRILASLATIDIPLDAGDFCVMNRKVVDALNSLPERNRFVRGLRTWVGYRQIGLAYERHARATGEPKYTFQRLVTLAFDGVFNFSYKPLRFLMMTGILVGGFAFLAGLLFLYQYITDTTIFGYNPRYAQGWTSLILSVLFLAGTQLIGIGVLGEYIGRLFEETKGRPLYLVDRQVGFGHYERLHPGPLWSPKVNGEFKQSSDRSPLDYLVG